MESSLARNLRKILSQLSFDSSNLDFSTQSTQVVSRSRSFSLSSGTPRRSPNALFRKKKVVRHEGGACCFQSSGSFHSNRLGRFFGIPSSGNTRKAPS